MTESQQEIRRLRMSGVHYSGKTNPANGYSIDHFNILHGGGASGLGFARTGESIRSNTGIWWSLV